MGGGFMKGFMIILILIVLAGSFYYLRVHGQLGVLKRGLMGSPTGQTTPVKTSSSSGNMGEVKPSEKTSTEVAKEIKVSMARLRFDPSTVTIKAGEKVKLTLFSDVSHTYTIDRLGINFVVDGGQTKSFDLRVDEPGTYDVYCAIPGHKEVGMVGKLVVE